MILARLIRFRSRFAALSGLAALLAAELAFAGDVTYQPLFRRGQPSDQNFCYAAWKDASRWRDGDAGKQTNLDHCWDFMSIDGKRWIGLPPWSELKRKETLSNYQLWHVNAYLPFGDYQSMYYVAREARVGRLGKQNLKKSVELNKRAAKGGHSKAQYFLGLHYVEGHGVERNLTDGLMWLERAASNGDIDAKVYLAYMYEVGKGVTKDLKRARALYEAVGEAHQFAAASVARLQSTPTQVAKKPSTSPSQPSTAGSSTASADSTSNAELAFWTAIASSNDPDEFREYLRQYPNGTYAGLAKLRINKLGGDASNIKPVVPNLEYGNYHALLIGNNNYDDLTNLRTAVSDVQAIANLLEVDYGFNVIKLENAGRSEILRAISRLRSEIGENDNVLIYYAGHGYLDPGADEGYWLPSDAERDDQSNWILTSRVVSSIRAMQAKHVMVVADSCFSGTITRAIKIDQRTPDYLQQIVKAKSRTALTSGGLEPVMDGGGGRHSVFANAFISLLESNDSVIDGSQLFADLRRKVMDNSTQTPQYGNIHQAGHDGGDFVFVRQ